MHTKSGITDFISYFFIYNRTNFKILVTSGLVTVYIFSENVDSKRLKQNNGCDHIACSLL